MLYNERRSDLEVVADILRIKGSKTAIMYGANLSYGQMQRYLSRLSELAFIECVEGRKGRREYHSTPKGEKLVELVENLEQFVNGNSS